MKPYFDNNVVQLYQADAREIPLPDQSVHCVVTSRPYFGLRVYQDNDDRGIGLEASVEAYVTNVVDVFREVRRVLRDDGVLWLNMGDTYGANSTGGGPRTASEKQLSNVGSEPFTGRNSASDGARLGIPERVVMGLQADGWIWRDTVIWAKKSAMPESVNGWRYERCRVKVGREGTDWLKTPKGWDTGEGAHDEIPDGNYRRNGEREATIAVFEDCPGCPKCDANDGLVLRRGSWRCTSSHEYIYMLTKGMGYFCDVEAVREGVTGGTHSRGPQAHIMAETAAPGSGIKSNSSWDAATWGPVSARNRRSVWNGISPEPYGGSHFATFPSDLPRICIQASTSERGVCPECGSQWARILDHKNMVIRQSERAMKLRERDGAMRTAPGGTHDAPAETQTIGWRATCGHTRNPVPATVLDPFAGTATTCLAAQKLGRRAVGVDISGSYLKQAVKRLSAVPLPLLSSRI